MEKYIATIKLLCNVKYLKSPNPLIIVFYSSLKKTLFVITNKIPNEAAKTIVKAYLFFI